MIKEMNLRKKIGMLMMIPALFSGIVQASGLEPQDEIDEKVAALLDKMSIEEKAGQMTQVTIDMILKDDETMVVDEAKLRKALLEKHVGSILNVKEHAYPAEVWQDIITQIQNIAVKETANKIPVIYGIDAIHGSNYTSGSTLFPHNIGMAAARNPELVKTAAKITAIETKAVGIPWNFDPVLDVGRQPLWPRFEETFGEDVYLVGELGAAAIIGYEEDGLDQPTAVASSMKHYLGYSVPLTGKDRTPAYIPDNILREYILPPFKRAVEAGAATVMINSGEINGVPVHGSKYYMTDILRDELGFEGVAVSDWEDVIRLHTRHRVADSPKEAVRQAVEAGLDMSMVPLDYSFYDLLVELVKEGTISEERLDLSVGRILKLKFALGLFDNPFPKKEALKELHKEAYDVEALKAARETMTLLKNNDNILPLSKKTKVLVAGPSAQDITSLHSSWSFIWQGSDASKYPESTQSIKEAIEKKIGKKNVISSAQADYSSPANFDVNQLTKDAAKADYIILCLGEKAYAESPGVIDDLTLDKNQLDLAHAAIATGKPVILVLVEGRPRVISSIEEGIKGVLMAYRPSTMGAEAIADVLFGDYNPSGILPFTYPRHPNDLVLYDRKGTEEIREDKPNVYGQGGYNPQWPFGFGLSYTTFAFNNLKTDKSTFGPNDKVQVTVDVKNTGKRDGKVAVELYSKDLYASITPNAKRLRKFDKIDLKAGETKQVSFTISPEDLAFVNMEGKWITEPGEFELLIGDKVIKIDYK